MRVGEAMQKVIKGVKIPSGTDRGARPLDVEAEGVVW